jgi:hypothetical protein
LQQAAVAVAEPLQEMVVVLVVMAVVVLLLTVRVLQKRVAVAVLAVMQAMEVLEQVIRHHLLVELAQVGVAVVVDHQTPEHLVQAVV